MTIDAPMIDITDAPAAADVDVLATGLIDFNEPYLGPADFRRLGVLARLDGGLVGGLSGETARGFLFVELLWVAASHRRTGLGTRLLRAGEQEARARGCRFALLETFDFQARSFYERYGYRLIGELAGFPNAHVRFTLLKVLGGDA